MKLKTIFFHIVVLSLVAVCQSGWAQSADKLWYQQSGEHFEETLVLGNGKMGASVFGGVQTDKIFLNDATLWSGEPVDPYMNPEAYKHLPAIREALKNENYKLADSLNRKLQGSFSQSYAPLGTLLMNFNHEGEPTNYYRELDLNQAISKVTYVVDGATFTREYFVSHPNQIMAIKLTSSAKGLLNLNVAFESLLNHSVVTSANMVQAIGRAPIHAAPSYLGNIDNAVVADAERGTRFSTLITIKNTDGELSITDTTLVLSNATEAIVFVSVATSFNGFDKNPATHGLDDLALAQAQLSKVVEIPYQQLKMAHIKDYQQFYKRLKLNLGATTAPDLPTDKRLKRYAEGHEDRNLEVLYFQFGRYLLISSSRTPGVPANLQGIWNPHLRPPWSSNYTMNINVEENYWLAENANLSEMHWPLLSFIENLSKTGAITAKTFYGVNNGWVACHNSDIWAMTNPVGNFGQGDPAWANWNMGGAWISTHLWEHYLFTQDKEYLKNFAYELMKGAAQFCLEWLVEDGNGNLVTSPSTSPENIYKTPDGYQGATLYGATADLAMIRACFRQTIEASKVLGEDEAFRQQLEIAMARLYPYQVGKNGHLQEWYHDWEDADPYHRHQSQLFGLFPGYDINPETSPELANASRKTLEIKGDETTGWSKGWRINLWARLWDGNRAYKMYRELLRYVEPDGIRPSYSGGGGTYPNLLDAHPPFQIDGNFGGAAAVIEMLVQSTPGEIRLLPALPDAWRTGSVSGICARGGFEVSMEWKDGKLLKILISSKNGGKTRLIFGPTTKNIKLKKGASKEFKWK